MSNDPLVAHSIAEAKLYLLARACPSCAQGPVRSAVEGQRAGSAGRTDLTLSASCEACGHRFVARFAVTSAGFGDTSKVINPVSEPSRILDLAQWTMLSTMLLESSRREPDKVRGRQLRIEAGLCLDEALKFYGDAENDLPTAEAFFTGETRALLKDSPERFSRSRLRNMRAALPVASRS